HALEYLAEYGVAALRVKGIVSAVQSRIAALLLIQLLVGLGNRVGVQEGIAVIHLYGLLFVIAQLLDLIVVALHGLPGGRIHRAGLIDEELAAVGVAAGIGHGQRTPDVDQIFAELILKSFAPDALAAGAVALGVAALNHKVFHDPMESQTVIITLLDQHFEVVNGFGSCVRKQPDADFA